MLEISVRTAVVAASDVRRKDRRVCMNEPKDEAKNEIKKYEGSFRERERAEGNSTRRRKRSTPINREQAPTPQRSTLNAERPTPIRPSQGNAIVFSPAQCQGTIGDVMPAKN